MGKVNVDDSVGVASDRQPNGEPRPKRRKGDRHPRENDRSPPTDISIGDMAGVDDVLDSLIDCVWLPLRRGRRFERLNYRWDDGVLLHGPSGCGKTCLAHAMAASLGVSFIPVSAPSLVGGTSGESEKNIREVFDEAIRLAPCLVFLDEIESIAGKRESAQKAMEGRMVAEISHGMDKVGKNAPAGKNVVVLAATNRPDSIEPAVRRRFGIEIDMGIPNEKAREQILRAMTQQMALEPGMDYGLLAKMTPGFVGADLKKVVTSAVSLRMRTDLNRDLETASSSRPDAFLEKDPGSRKWLLLEADEDEFPADVCITLEDFKAAIGKVQPASKREGFSTIPDTTWANVGAMQDVRKKLEMTIIGPIKEPERFARVGIKPAAGILLWGPPGCGKTLVAKAVANESKANFISIKGPELLNKYVGESERAVRQLFSRAKSSAPCILFFDEMDALVPKRDDSLSDASARVVNTLLTELDGVGDRSGIYVIGATNRPDIIDPAIRRPGRLGTSIFVGLPTEDDRVDILTTLYRNTIKEGKHEPRALEAVARDVRCRGFSGADLGNLMQAAAQACLERTHGDGAAEADLSITEADWERALREVKPSVKGAHRYDELVA
jgi:ribosome biogenesis ATPase